MAVYAAITFVLALPLSLHPGGSVLSVAPDTDLYMWTLAWDAHALVTQPLRIFDANIYFPQALTLAYSENLIGSAFFAAPVLWLTGNPVLAMNIVALLSCVLCGIGAFLLGRGLASVSHSAAVSGLVFAFAPPRFLRLDQLHLITVQWIPFALASAHVYFEGGRRRDLWLTLLFFTLQALTSGHGAVFVTVALAGVVDLAARCSDVRWQRCDGCATAGGRVRCSSRRRSPPIVPYLIVQRQMGLRRTLEDWAVPASSFLASPSHVQVALLSLFPSLADQRDRWCLPVSGRAAACFLRFLPS